MASIVIGRTCAKPGCGTLIAFNRFACKEHWYSLPESIRLLFSENMSASETNALHRLVLRYFATPAPKPCTHCDCAFFHDTPETPAECECGHPAEEHAR